jgi:hypothetical protein
MTTSFNIPSDILDNGKNQFLDITNKLNDYNEIDNLNNHLLSANNSELSKLTTYNNQLKTKLMKMKQDYMLMDYSIYEMNMYNNIIIFTIVVMCFLFFIVAKIDPDSRKLLIIICTLTGLFYLIVLIIMLTKSVNRRKYSWNQWYFSPVIKKN